MERTAQKFSSYQQAEEASRLYYQRLSPAKRLEILLQLIDRIDDDQQGALRARVCQQLRKQLE